MDNIQKELIKAGRKDLAQEYFNKIAQNEKVTSPDGWSQKKRKEIESKRELLQNKLDEYNNLIGNFIAGYDMSMFVVTKGWLTLINNDFFFNNEINLIPDVEDVYKQEVLEKRKVKSYSLEALKNILEKFVNQYHGKLNIKKGNESYSHLGKISIPLNIQDDLIKV
jgi:predicted metal-dependent hydrolase